PFGETDEQFGLDISFYAFQLPLWRAVVTWVMVAVVLAFLANLLTHYLFGGLRPGAAEGALTRAARIQLVTLAGLFVLAKAAAYWLDRYEPLCAESSTITGASYTDVDAVMPAKIVIIPLPLAGLFVLAKAAASWLDRYELLFAENSTFTGASYTDVNAVMPAKIFMFAAALVCAIAFFSAIVIKDLRIPALATVLLLFSA